MNILKSRTNWTIAVTFLLGGFESISGFMSPEISTLVLGLLSALAIYFRTNPKVDFKS